jgi:type IV secretion system protein VirD4
MSSIQQRSVRGGGLLGFARWWWRWWRDTRGWILGLVVPAWFAVVGVAIGAPVIPLALALGLAVALVWPMGAGGKALAVLGGMVGLLVLTGVVAGAAGVAFLIFALVGNGAMALAIWGAYRWLFGPGIDPHYGARWAGPGDTADMVMWEDDEGLGRGVALALHEGELIGVAPGFEGRRELGNFLICGPARSGKTLHLVTNLLTWLGSVVTLDIKGELYRLTASAREEKGQDVYVLDPKGRGDRYDPFRELSYSPEALRSAALLVMEPERERQPIFAQRAANALYAAVIGARVEGRPTLPYVRELTSEGAFAFVQRLASLDDPEIRRALVDFLGLPPERLKPEAFEGRGFLPDAWGTMIGKLSPFFAEGVLKMCGGSDFEAADLVRGPSSLYLMFEEGQLRYTHKIFSVVVLALSNGLIRRADLEPDEETLPMLLALDEAGRTPIPGLDDLVSTIPGRGMSALIYVQDLAQLEGAYGRAEAQTVRSNCHAQLYYRPTDYDTAAHISRRCGQTSVRDVHVSGTFGEKRSYGQRARELVTPDEVMQMEGEDVIAFTGKKPPILGRRLEWFNLFSDAEELMDNPAPEVPDLPMPEIATAGPNAERNGEAKGQAPASGASRLRRRRRRRREERTAEGEKEVGGYVEPEL